MEEKHKHLIKEISIEGSGEYLEKVALIFLEWATKKANHFFKREDIDLDRSFEFELIPKEKRMKIRRTFDPVEDRVEKLSSYINGLMYVVQTEQVSVAMIENDLNNPGLLNI